VVLRGEAQLSIAVTPVEERDDLMSAALANSLEKGLVLPLGIIGVEIDPPIAAAATGLRDPFGIIVVARADGGGEVPLQPRDIIRSVNNRRVATLRAIRESVEALKPGSAVTLQIQRDGRLMYVTFTLD
jgi:S1-C subfamily serine protease